MKVKMIKKLRVNSTIFNIKWDKEQDCAGFDYGKKTITLGTNGDENRIFLMLNHELMEIALVEMNVRYRRRDCNDYIFVFDHRQFDTTMEMFTGLLSQFLE